MSATDRALERCELLLAVQVKEIKILRRLLEISELENADLKSAIKHKYLPSIDDATKALTQLKDKVEE